MRALGILGGKHPADIGHGVTVQPFDIAAQRAGKIVGVGDRDIAFARHKTAQLIGVPALRVAGKVVDHALRPGCGRLRAVVFNHRRQQGLRIHVGGGPVTHHALIGRIGEAHIVAGRGFHPVLGVKDDARTLRKSEPLILVILQIGGHAGLQHIALHRLQHARILGPLQAGGIHGQQDIGGRIGPFGLHPGNQLICLALDPVHRDAR
mmetsp:Transcript_19774/g.32227  ORF Transcript_19774/g.32227 Transcript_19774/m.32227 type:complete len:207 (+) Transcript_19774:299-919(+)